MKVTILDGYLDEPSCLGVPPYLAPHLRYTYGALKESGLKEGEISYLTIDQFRVSEGMDKLTNADLVIIMAGTTVPGKYLGGRPISIKEIEALAKDLTDKVILSGPIINCAIDINHIKHFAFEIPGLKAYQMITDRDPRQEYNPAQLIDRWAKLGAELTTKHPNFPHLMCEIETFRGCPRNNNCSFCSEGFKEIDYHRSVRGIIEEVQRLYKLGNRYFRLGGQTDLLLYQAKAKGSELIPNPKAIKKLYEGIRTAAPELKVLHMDNMNPSNIVNYPKESKEIIKTIAEHNTAGDIAAFGLESADPKVIKENQISATPAQTKEAVEIMNQIGGFREGGVPKLLPGINLLHGLQGEREKTMELNYKFLADILASDLLVRRINIRQVNPVGAYKTASYDQQQFKDYKEKINEEINQPMLKRVFPLGTILEEVIIEEKKGKTSFGRQIGSYPILVGIPGEYEIGEKLRVKVIDYGYRSITALPAPFDINEAGIAQLESLPGIGKNRALKIFMAGEIKSLADLEDLLEGYDISQLKEIVDFSV